MRANFNSDWVGANIQTVVALYKDRLIELDEGGKNVSILQCDLVRQ